MKRTAAPPAPGGGGNGPGAAPKKPAEVSNGKAPAPLTYSRGEPADDVNMNEVEDKVTLTVILTSGKSTTVTVDSNIPMLDLLVHLAARCKVSPSGHELQVQDEETGKVLEFKPNQTIGSLGATSVYLLAKQRKPDWSQAAKAGKASMAFEITQRFTINLPGGQKAVMRVSPQLTLGQVLAKVCQDKRLDNRRYTLQHPAHPQSPFPLNQTIADSKLSEINLVHTAGDSRSSSAADAPRSSTLSASDASAAVSGSQDPASWYMPGTGETKKKKGFLSFLSKKEKKFKLESHHSFETSSTTSHQSSSTLPPPRSTTPPPDSRSSSRPDVWAKRPHTMYVSSSPQDSSREQLTDSLMKQPRHSPRGEGKDSPIGQVSLAKDGRESRTLPRGGGKKRPAPPPPQAAKAAVSEEVVQASAAPVAASVPATSSEQTLSPACAEVTSAPNSIPFPASAEVAVTDKPGSEGTNASLLHSRNSSDSSGYHELTLSGAESPEAAHLPTTFKTSIDTTSIDSGDNLNGDSGIQDISPPAVDAVRRGGREEVQHPGRADVTRPQVATADTARTLPSTKKKKAPPPPPKAKPAPVQEETSVVAKDETDLPCPDRSTTAPQTEETLPPPPPLPLPLPPPLPEPAADPVMPEKVPAPPAQQEEAPTSLKLTLDFSEESDVDTERRADDEDIERQPAAEAESESKEAFDLDDILNSVVFDEEPRRTSINIHTIVPPRREEEEQEMVMVETGSVVSEEVEVLDDVRSRPCEFIPPPPPEEPPPEDYSPRGSGPRYADKSTVVGEDNVSLAPASLKNSPVAKERGTPEVRGTSDKHSADLTAHLPPQTGLAASSDSLPPSDTLMKEAQDSGTQQVICQCSGTDDQQSTQGVPAHTGASLLLGDGDENATALDSAFAMTEEISAPLETVPPPLQFQTEEEEEEEEEGEEEEIVTVTEEYIVPLGPGGLDFSAAVKVSKEEKKDSVRKEANILRDVGNKGTDEERKVEDSPRQVEKREPESQSVRQDVVEQTAPPLAKKEEFVLTLEDLSSVSLVPLRPKKYVPSKAAPVPASAPVPAEEEVVSEASGSGSPQRAHLHLAYVSDRGHVQPAPPSSPHSATFTMHAHHPSAASHTAKESSATASSVSASTRQGPESAGSSRGDGADYRYRSTATVTMAGTSSSEVHLDSFDRPEQADARSKNSRVRDVPLREGAEPPAQGSGDLQQQYNSLQQQFTVWQQQLQQNQTLLTAQGGRAPTSDTLKTLQMQMQMQQQMMEQLQRSMQALSLQQQQQNIATQGRVSPQAPAAVPVMAPAPPSAPAPVRTVSRPTAKKITTQPVSSRFQPQLDPREELMIAIRSFGGISGLKTVQVRDTRWASGNH